MYGFFFFLIVSRTKEEKAVNTMKFSAVSCFTPGMRTEGGD